MEASITAAILSLFASRWFGGVAGWISGFSFVAMIALWGEDRGADIDVSNTLFANLAALCILEIHLGGGRRRGYWVALAGLAVGGSLLVKGPAGMTIILGAVAWIAIVTISNRQMRSLFRPRFWLPLVIGAAILTIWILLAIQYLRLHDLPVDNSGWREGTQDLHPHDWSWKRAGEWIFLPETLFLFTLPVSLSLLWALFRGVQGARIFSGAWFRAVYENLRGASGATAGQADRLIGGLAASVLLAWLICFISGMHLPRYGYVTLPLLCPLAGALASRVPRMDAKARWWVRTILMWTVVAYGIAIVALSGVLWRHTEIRPLLIAIAIVAVVVAVITNWRLNGVEHWRGLAGIPVLLLLLSVALGSFNYYDRLARTTVGPARMIRDKVGPDATLVTCMMVLDQPELFYYTGLPTIATNGDKLDWRPLKLGTWVVLEAPELEKWNKEIPSRLAEVIPFTVNKGSNKGFLVRYDQTHL